MLVLPVRVTPATKAKLDDHAPRHGLTPSQLARSLINDGLRRLEAGAAVNQSAANQSVNPRSP